MADRKKSLHDVLRERRAAKPLLSVKDLQRREAAKRREEADALARERVERWLLHGQAVDAEKAYGAEEYRAIFAVDRAAYFGSRHWARRVRAQLRESPRCEVERCSRETDLAADHLRDETIGAERPGHDLVTLCEACGRRARKRASELGRRLTQAEIRRLDPDAALFDLEAIASLRARYARPLRRADVRKPTGS